MRLLNTNKRITNQLGELNISFEVQQEKFHRINTGLPDCLIVDNFSVINHF